MHFLLQKKTDDEKDKKNFKAIKQFYLKKKKEILTEWEKRTDKLALNCVLVDQIDEQCFTYKLCHDKRQAVSMCQNRQVSLCGIFSLPSKQNTHKLTTKSLPKISVELIDPNTKKVIFKGIALFDTGADVASVPLDREKIKSLVRSFTEINNKLVPIIYLEIKVNGYLVDGVHEIEIEKDRDWCAIGLPQLAILDEHTKQQMRKIFR